MLNISQFAKECGTTVKTIRHYDNIGLLNADYISEESGYRYYRRTSVIKYHQIVKLKQSGFTLKEIKENFSDYNVGGNLSHIEQKMFLLKKQQEICENMKKYRTTMEQEIARHNLLKYCELDTYAMVKIWQKLKELCE